MARQALVLGAGPVGAELTRQLVAGGVEVRVATRSGTTVDGAQPVTADAADAQALIAAATGSETIYVCTNPPYHRWAVEWPPVVDAVIAAARAHGATVVMAGNLYPYGRPDGPMRADSPERPTETKGRVRAELWRRLREAHERGDIQAAEVRASDYFGPGAGAAAHAGIRFVSPVLADRTARVIGAPEVPHSWAYLPDFAATMARVVEVDGALGRVWIAPHAATISLRALAARINEIAGSNGSVRAYPRLLLRAMALASPMMREVLAIAYQHTEPYVVDDSETRDRLSLQPTPLDEALRRMLDRVQGQS